MSARRATPTSLPRRVALIVLLLGVASIASPRAATAQTTPAGTGQATPTAPAPALAGLDWIAGTWILERPGEWLEEWWSAPVGNSLVGHFRWIRQGDLWITESLSITEESEGVVFRLRHFGADMRPWEAADDTFVYLLTERDQARAVFTIAEPRPGRPTRIVYQALPGDSLMVRLEGEEDGRPSVQDFRYGRGR